MFRKYFRRLELYLCRRYLPIVLSQPCPSTIPRTGEEGALVNCFVVQIGEPFKRSTHLVDAFDGDVLTCRRWEDKRFQVEEKLRLEDIKLENLRISHFSGHNDITFFGAYDLAIGLITRSPYLLIWQTKVISDGTQFLYNKKKLVTKERVDLLKTVLKMRLAGDEAVSSPSLMVELHTDRAYLHPHFANEELKLEFYLDSMVETGELIRDQHRYKLTGVGLNAIEKYEEQERHHSAQVRIQRWIAALTLIMALTGIAGLVIQWVSKKDEQPAVPKEKSISVKRFTNT